MTILTSFRPSKMPCAFQLLLALQLTTCVLGTSELLQFSPNVREMSFTTGDTAELHCTVRRPAPGNFTWTGPAVSSGRATIVNFASGIVSKLTIVGFTQQDVGQYSCSFTGVSNISIPLRVVSTPGFLTVPEHQVFVEGTDAVVECPAFFGNPPVRMLWSRDGQLIRNESRFTPENGRLRIQNIRMDDMGDNYECRLLLSNGASRKTIKVEVVARSELAPRIDDANRRTEVAYGDPLDLPCIIDEPKDNVTYSWTINTEFEHDHHVNTSANLHREAHKFLGGIYTCRAENEHGYDVVDFVVKVVGPPLPKTCSLVKKVPAFYTTVVLKYCDLTSAVELSDLSIEWKKKVATNGQLVTVSPEGRFSMNHDQWLTIENLQSSDLGEYQVTITSENGSAVHTVQLELEGETTTSPSQVTSQALSGHSQSQLAAVALNLRFEIQSEIYSCADIKEEAKNFIQQELTKQFHFSGAMFEAAVVNCPSDSKSGTFRATLSGRNAKQLANQIKMRGLSPLTLENGLTVTLSVCTDECSPLKQASPKLLSNLSGGIIAAVFICVVLAGLVLLVVILVRYRRRSLPKYTDEEQVLPLNFSGTGQCTYKTNPDIFHPKLSKKPVYSRSISLTFPISR